MIIRALNYKPELDVSDELGLELSSHHLQEQTSMSVLWRLPHLDCGVSSSLSQDKQMLHWKHPAAHENKNARPHPRCQKPLHQ
jgi:hypothetical protein